MDSRFPRYGTVGMEQGSKKPWRVKQVRECLARWFRRGVRLDRLRGQYCTLAGLSLSLLFVDSLVGFGIRRAPEKVAVPSRYVWEEFESVGGKIAGMDRIVESGNDGVSGAYGVFVGSSSTRAGVAADILEASDGMDLRWIVLAGGGPDFSDLTYLLRPLRLMKTPPRVVVIGMHRFLLVNKRWRTDYTFARGRSHPIVSACRTVWRTVSYEVTLWLTAPPGAPHGAPWNSLAQAFRSAATFIQNDFAMTRARDFTRLWARHITYRLHFALVNRFGQSPAALFPPLSDPTQERTSGGLFNEAPDLAFVAGLMREFPEQIMEGNGQLAASNYQTDSYSARGFSTLLHFLQSLDTELVVVMMPELSRVRGIQPSRGNEVLDLILAKHSEKGPITRIDMSDAMPDELFVDFAHLTPVAGRREFSRKVGAALGAQLREPSATEADPPRLSLPTGTR